jgi:hypothetical protein
MSVRPDRVKSLDAKYAKFTVIEIISSHNFRLDTPPGIHNVFHSNKLHLAGSDPLPSQTSDDSQPLPEIVNEEEEYEVEAILNKRVLRRGRGRQKQYLVKWKGYARST